MIGIQPGRFGTSVLFAVAAGSLYSVVVRLQDAEAFTAVVAVFAAAIALWAPNRKFLAAGAIGMAIALLAINSSTFVPLVALPAVLALTTAPAAGVASWAIHAVGVGVPLIATAELLPVSWPAALSVAVLCVVALALLAISHRLARR